MNKSSPFFSVIIPVLNSVITIEKCLNSLINDNNNASYELIIFDGGSIDGTIEILEKYREFITILHVAHDKGPHYAVNNALKITSGQVIVILCADDYLEKDVLIKVQNKFIENPDIDLVSCGIKIFDNSGNLIKSYIKKNQLDFSIGNIINTPLSHGRFIKKSLYDSHGGFPTKFNLCNDLYFLLKIKICEDIKSFVIETYAYNYLSHPQSSTMGNNKNLIIDTFIDNYLIAYYFIKNFEFNLVVLFHFYSLFYKSLVKYFYYKFFYVKNRSLKLSFDDLILIVKGIYFIPLICVNYIFTKCKTLRL